MSGPAQHDYMLTPSLEEEGPAETAPSPSTSFPTSFPELPEFEERNTPQDPVSVTKETPTRGYSNADTPSTFNAKIDAFFLSSAAMVHQPPVNDEFSYVSPISTYHTASLDLSVPPVTTLSRSQVDCLLGLFWSSYHLHFPILSEEAFKAHYNDLWTDGGAEQAASPLVDAVIALCAQYAYSSNLVKRLLGLKDLRMSYNHDVSLTGFCYMRRCRASLDTSATTASPSLTTVKCYIFMTIYLLNAGQYQTAYNMLGLAVRIGHGLGLHQEPSSTLSQEQSQLRKRTWWVLVHLDMKCSRELGNPIAIQPSVITCSFADEEYNGAGLADIGGLAYHVHSVRLTSTTLNITEIISRRNSTFVGDSTTAVEARAQILSEELGPLRQWKESIRQTTPFTGLRLDFDQPIQKDHYSPLWLQRQFVCLELQYYHTSLILHRPFICFPSHLSPHTPRRSLMADAHAVTCLRSAITLIRILHATFSDSDILHGWLEIYQLQWVAVLATVGFILAYPLCVHQPVARKALDEALEIFDICANNYSVAARAATLTRSMCVRVDKLVEFLKAGQIKDQGIDVGVPSEQGGPSANGVEASDINEPASTLSHEVPDSEWYGEDLSSWMQGMNPGLGMGYQNELDDFFTGLPDFPIMDDAVS